MADEPVLPRVTERSIAAPSRIRTALLLVIGALLVLNLLSLANNEIHSRLYTGLESLAGSLAVTGALRSSPTEANRKQMRQAAAAADAMAVKAVTDATREMGLRLAALNSANKTLTTQNVALQTTVEDYRQTGERRLVATRTAVDRLFKRAGSSASRNVGGVFLEAIPYAGVAAMLSITALDVKDACDTVRDMNELAATHGFPKDDEDRVCGMKVPSPGDVVRWVRNRGSRP